MDRSDLTFALDQLNFLGFQNIPEDRIEAKIRQDVDKFRVDGEQQFNQFGSNQTMEYSIHFKKYDRLDAYHPYMYHGTLKDQPEKTQVFRMANDDAFTARDAFNLLNGRAVYKWIIDWDEHRMKGHWFQLDFREKDIHGNFKIDQLKITDKDYQIGNALMRYPITELNNPDQRIRLILSLYCGNCVPVTLNKAGKEERGYAEAAPQRNAVNIYTRPGVKFIQSKVQRASQNNSMLSDQSMNPIKRNKRKGKSM